MGRATATRRRSTSNVGRGRQSRVTASQRRRTTAKKNAREGSIPPSTTG